MTKISSPWIFITVLASSFLLVVVGHWLSGRLQPATLLELPYDPGCDLRQGSCISTLSAGSKAIFSIEPRSLPVLKPLALDITVEGLEPRKVGVDFNGVDMNMGINHADLAAAGKNRFSGTITIPVCIRNSMEWEAKVSLYTSDGIIVVPYRFWSSK